MNRKGSVGLGGVFRNSQRGYGLGGVFRGSPYQKGYGLGGFFSKLINWISPFFNRAKDNLLPTLKTTAKNIGSEVIGSAANIAKDIIQGKEPQKSAEEHINKSIDKLTQKGSGINKTHKRKRLLHIKPKLKKKKRVLDIFD